MRIASIAVAVTLLGASLVAQRPSDPALLVPQEAPLLDYAVAPSAVTVAEASPAETETAAVAPSAVAVAPASPASAVMATEALYASAVPAAVPAWPVSSSTMVGAEASTDAAALPA